MIEESLRSLLNRARKAVTDAKNMSDIDALDIAFLGRKGELADLMKQMSSAKSEDRPKLGAMANEVKTEIEKLISLKRDSFAMSGLQKQLDQEREDVTEPGIKPAQGHLHLMNHAIRDIEKIFTDAGFVRVRYPEVEWDKYAFENLNMPADHPARDEWETFFVDTPPDAKNGKMILTPHATSGTARILSEKDLPIRAINISKTYRRQIDLTHVPMFHQFDGLIVDKGLNLTHLLGILDYFVKSFFGPDRKVRVRPYHFRFTEPSFEVDISTDSKMGKNGWLELGGAGMLHPNVLKAAGIDPEVYTGLAFGWGVERTYMMREGLHMDDIRTLYKNDLRFLNQF
ncbi:phenylalanine--tRNA ligase subunit alpha [Candidatus Uhrbacteria bacterium]|nr:phenylalanine--tRNA ligase subunit alpha [Candidatus Uhrbacteria bacterium]